MAHVTHCLDRYYSSADWQQCLSVTLTSLTEWWKDTKALLIYDTDKVDKITDEYQLFSPLCHP
jgi:hypothetical protein